MNNNLGLLAAVLLPSVLHSHSVFAQQVEPSADIELASKPTSIAQNETTQLSSSIPPKWLVEFGVQYFQYHDFSYQNLDFGLESISVRLALGYQFTPNLGVKFAAHTGESCWLTDMFGACTSSSLKDDSLLRADYSSKLYSLEATYSANISGNWYFDASMGSVYGVEKFDFRSCKADDGIIFKGCDESEPINNYSNTETQFSYLAGVAIRYAFNNYVGLKLGYTHTGINEGTNSTGISIQARF
ncbi:hypothetical protein G3R49_05495 [Shewanella sp. WXL01]|uniref:outer membrane beta-barrel protein n=1 Tax=Shewanella sp. WXL01 TaxID=2709721 RepID=UPI0014385E08|nr:outer membrane beta-barrel protein [Shewanella sp. WXL01]NKF50023.1 hypothetical protein [Shewanella sp. WXL01]